MEVAIIDWENIDSRFVKDELYEHINAPKWVDFSGPDEPVDDEAWFCRPSCNHPKTAEEFFKEKERTPTSNPRHQRSASVSDIPPLGDKIKRDATIKKRGINQPFALSSNKDTKPYRVVEDAENQDPNLSTPVNHKAKSGKEGIKSSSEKKPINDAILKNERAPKLRSTLSARNLFSGGDILNKVAEFCNDLKNLATRAKDRENDRAAENLDDLNKEKERKPLLETSKEKSEVIMGMSGSKGQLRRKKKNDDGENTPISIDVKNNNNIRTCPPTPQCFSAGQGLSKAATPKPFRTRPLVCTVTSFRSVIRFPLE
ncbi:hypothetical protein PHJA_000629000 [Phtheirospermum japonicum]|uniref:Uncharacterized protein n=1 Tax=Phtheirospermum japonicum TaxID=374723 RepID=A0A830BFB9_9LAMI|nr:hypothetical protein PHJA_000629000 [Phtheirospermum japonicum]